MSGLFVDALGRRERRTLGVEEGEQARPLAAVLDEDVVPLAGIELEIEQLGPRPLEQVPAPLDRRPQLAPAEVQPQIGRASCRESVSQRV